MKSLLLAMVVAWAAWIQPVLAEQSDDTRRAQIHTQLGSGYLGMGKIGIALNELNIALSSDSKYAPAYNVLGLAYMEMRDDVKAEENFKRSLELDATNSEANNNYGWFLCQRQRMDEAIDRFMIALKNPLYATPEIAYLNAGLCYLKKGDEARAEDFLLRSTKSQTVPQQALFQLSELYLRRGSFLDAQFYLEHYLKVAGPTAEGLWLATRIAHRFGKREMENSYGWQLKSKFPDSREALAFRNNMFDEATKVEGAK
jgi:type IV pilus assembly protein PilF